MDLIDRYLQAVRFWLPRSEKQDIVSELAEDIRSEVEEREAELGRPLDQAETGSLLKKRGSPFSVAEKYLPQRSLIGPGLYPIYLFVLKVVGVAYLLPWLAVWLFCVLFLPSYRAAHPGMALFGTLGTWWNIALWSFAVITLAFAVAERLRQRPGASEKWDPRRLPKVRDTRKIPRSSSLAEILLGLIFLVWWLGRLNVPSIAGRDPDFTGWTPGFIWQNFYRNFYWVAVFVTLASLGLAAANLLRPYWTRVRLGARAALDAVTGAVAFLAIAPYFEEVKALWLKMSGAHAGLSNLETLQNWTNIAVFAVFALAGFIALGSCLARLIRIVFVLEPAKAPGSPEN